MTTITIADIVHRHAAALPEAVQEQMITDLVGREEGACDYLRTAGTQLWTFPELVAGALMQAGLGEPVSEQTRAYVQGRFEARVEEMQNFMRQHGL